LESDIAAWFNESVYYPYTSLKYHTLLVAVLVSNYEAGAAFEELALVVDAPATIVPHRTILAVDVFSLRLTTEADGRPSSGLGSRPTRSWASIWTRLPAHPLDTNHERWTMTLDANLRRIQSWSTALQYIEDFQEWRTK
jgi:hypothetical protein